MLPNSNSKAMGSDPGACMVPRPAPVPVPFPNVEQTSGTEGAVDKVHIKGQELVPIKVITL